MIKYISILLSIALLISPTYSKAQSADTENTVEQIAPDEDEEDNLYLHMAIGFVTGAVIFGAIQLMFQYFSKKFAKAKPLTEQEIRDKRVVKLEKPKPPTDSLPAATIMSVGGSGSVPNILLPMQSQTQTEEDINSDAELAARLQGGEVKLFVQQVNLYKEVETYFPSQLQTADGLTLNIEVQDNGGDGWCGFNSLAAAMGIPTADLSGNVMTFLNNLDDQQRQKITDLLRLQLNEENSQFKNIQSLESLIEELQNLQTLANNPEDLPVIPLWLDGFLLQIFQAALEVHIVVVQGTNRGEGPNVLTHEGTHWAFTHFNNDFFTVPADAPVIFLTLGAQLPGGPVNHFQLLVINRTLQTTNENSPKVYQWLQKHVLKK